MPQPVSRSLRMMPVVVASAALTLALPRVGRAAGPTVPECVDANERSGPLGQAGKLREARASLLRCSAPSCPTAVRDDCISGAMRLERAIPTIVFVAKDGAGNEVTSVSVTMDGQPFADKLDGKALDVDPGEHVFRFTASGVPAIEKRIVLHAGEKNRHEQISLAAPNASVSVPPPSTPSMPPSTPLSTSPPPAEPKTTTALGPQRTVAIVVAGAGVVGLGRGTVFGLKAHSDWDQAKSDCGAVCAPTSKAQSEADDAHREATVANVAFGLGAASLVTGVVLWVLSPTTESAREPAKQSARVAPWIAPGISGLAFTGRLP